MYSTIAYRCLREKSEQFLGTISFQSARRTLLRLLWLKKIASRLWLKWNSRFFSISDIYDLGCEVFPDHEQWDKGVFTML